MIHGTYYFGRKRVACCNAYCTNCKAPRFAEGLKSLVVLHIFFIPILPIATTIRWFCTSCQKETEARRPSRPWILVLGIFFGFVMIFIGGMILIKEHEIEPAIGLGGLGLVMVSGLLYMIKKQNYQEYVSAQEQVTPLRGDICPYCKQPLFVAETPHCHECDVDILKE